MNDALAAIESDPEFGSRLAAAIGRFRSEPIDVPAISAKHGHYVKAAKVIETHHADYDVLVRVGGNRGEVVRDGK